MPQLFGVDVSADVYEANKHLTKPAPKAPKTDARKAIDKILRERLERQFDDIWARLGGDPDFWQAGHNFDDERGWHIDRYNAEHKIGVEIHGGQFMKKSGHSNAAGMQRDWEKVNRCNELGIVLFGLTTKMVDTTNIEKILNYVRRLR